MPTALIVEDDPIGSDLFRYVLERNGFTVVSTREPREAPHLASELKLDLLIADVVLRSPISGTQVAVELRRLYPGLPVLFISGTAFEGWSRQDVSNLESLFSAPVDFLMKPFPAEILAKTVKALLARDHTNTRIQASIAQIKKLTQRGG